MSARRYQVRSRIIINAPIHRAYWITIKPENVPKYAAEVKRIRVLRESPNGCRWVQSWISVMGVTIPFHYRYRYSPPRFYGGVQTREALLRGYFAMRFRPLGENATEVEHIEGITSRIPLLGRMVGWIWFRFLSPDGIDDELRRLKRLVESCAREAAPSM